MWMWCGRAWAWWCVTQVRMLLLLFRLSSVCCHGPCHSDFLVYPPLLALWDRGSEYAYGETATCVVSWKGECGSAVGRSEHYSMFPRLATVETHLSLNRRPR